MDWTLRKRTWCKIVTLVKSVFHPLKDEGKTPPPTEGKTPPPTYPTIHFSDRNIHTPVENGRSGLWDNTFSPLIQGGDSLLTPDVRVRTHLFIHVCFHMITYIWPSYMVSYMVSYSCSYIVVHIWCSYMVFIYRSPTPSLVTYLRRPRVGRHNTSWIVSLYVCIAQRH